MQKKHNRNLTPLAKKLRQEATDEERHLWYDFLRSYPTRFYRQKVIGKYIIDFYCHAAGIVIELDGSQHYEALNQAEDQKRTAFLEEYKLQVIRIPNSDISRNFRSVCEYIDTIVKKRLSEAAKWPQVRNPYMEIHGNK